MSNIIEFKTRGRSFAIYQAPAVELVDLILAVQDLGEAQGDSELEFKVNRKNYKEFADILLNTTFIVEKKSDGTDVPVNSATFVGLKDAPVLMEFIAKVISILMESTAPLMDDVNEKKTDSIDSLKENQAKKIRRKPIIKTL